MSTAEQETYITAHPNLTILDAPGVDGSIPVNLLTKLWENPDPSVAFTDDYINLSSTDYDILIFIAYFNTSNSNCISAVAPKGKGVYLTIADMDGNGDVNTYRGIFYQTDGQYKADHAYKRTASTVNDNALVPYQIYGIKSTVNVDVSAVISDVSTSADKCILTDGVTSVQDALVKHTEVTFTNKSISGNGKTNVGSLVSTLPSGSKLVSYVANGLDSDVMPYLNGTTLFVRNFNSSSMTATIVVDVYYI